MTTTKPNLQRCRIFGNLILKRTVPVLSAAVLAACGGGGGGGKGAATRSSTASVAGDGGWPVGIFDTDVNDADSPTQDSNTITPGTGGFSGATSSVVGFSGETNFQFEKVNAQDTVEGPALLGAGPFFGMLPSTLSA